MAQTAPYPTVAAPYGLKPINLIGGQQFAGQTRELPITTSSVNYNTAIFNGDIVTLVSGGTIQKSAIADESSPVAGLVGVFVGCAYTNPVTKQRQFAQYWPGFASGVTDAVAYVVDDPDALFKVVLVAGDTEDSTNALTPAFLGQTVVGSNVTCVQNSGSTVTGDSRIGVYTPGGQGTASTVFRVVDVVPDTANASGQFCELIVKFNFGYHSYYNAVGV
jgi:hypothetical protein